MDEILEKYQVRKSNKQKEEFISYLRSRLEKSGFDKEKDITVEEKGRGLVKSRNIIVGNPETAKVFFSAHYDTCAVIPFPNLIAPTNPFIFIGYQLVLTVLLLVIAAAGAYAVMLLTKNPIATYYSFLGMLFLLLYHLLFGYRNKHTANDNTSGVVLLTKLLEALPAEDREKVCVVYFDNEEKGLLGSVFFAKNHKNVVKDRMLINFDCVGDGDNVVTMAKGQAREDKLYPLFTEALEREEKTSDVVYLCRNMKFMMFPSDQSNFNKGIGVCSLKKGIFGRYVARIHTPLDTKCREENITYLTRAMTSFVAKIGQE